MYHENSIQIQISENSLSMAPHHVKCVPTEIKSAFIREQKNKNEKTYGTIKRNDRMYVR